MNTPAHIHAEPSAAPAKPCQQAVNPAWVAFFTRARELAALADARLRAQQNQQQHTHAGDLLAQEESCNTNDRE